MTFENTNSGTVEENKNELSVNDIMRSTNPASELCNYLTEEELNKFHQSFMQFARNRSGFGKLKSQHRHKMRESYDDNMR